MFNFTVKKWTSIISLVVLATVLLSVIFAGTVLAQGPTFRSPGGVWGQGSMNGNSGYNISPAPYGYGRSGLQMSPYGYGQGWGSMMGDWGYDWGMMDRWDYGMRMQNPNGAAPVYGYGWDDCPYGW